MAYDILIVDDEPDICMLIDGVLRDEGYDTRSAGDSDGAIAAFRVRRPSLVILDVWLQGSRLDGLGLLQSFHSEEPQVPVVMISGHGTIETAVAAIQQGAYDFIEKPFKADRLLLVLRRALEAAALARENAELRLRAGPETNLTGDSPPIAGLRAGVERVAPTGSRVLISGPAGSGKEVVARMIHARSRRADGPFIVLNCATLAPSRFEEELFGLEAGSDPVVSPRRAGVLERAHGGTLLLDEVSELPAELQVKILRVLQEREVIRVGSRRARRIDVRVIAASNVDLARAVREGRFRADLYYRLNVASVSLPSLRERRGDIVPLAEHFIARHGQRLGSAAAYLTAEATRALLAHDWPGNIRELENVIQAAIVSSAGGAVRPAHLRFHEGRGSVSADENAARAREEEALGALAGPLDELLQSRASQLFPKVEEFLVRRAFSHCHGNQVLAARLLGMPGNVMRTHLRRYGLIDERGTSLARA
jgi:two-component system, NtrC family, nitrogen regulation response regulator NtrX